VKRILGLSRRKTGNKIVISVEKLERRVALLEEGRLEEYSVERDSSRNIAGSVYKGRVKNIEPGLKAMFIESAWRRTLFSISGTPYPRRSTAGWRKSSGPSDPTGNDRIGV
jgi:ribonuclease G